MNFRQLDIKISYNISKGNENAKEEKEAWYQLYKIV